MLKKQSKKQQSRGLPFQKGQSGNPAGRPKGSRNKSLLAIEALMDGQAEAITKIVTEKALEGDIMAIRLVLDRIAPIRRERPVFFELPPLKTADDAVEAMSCIVGGVASGELTPTEANDLARIVDGFVKSLEACDLAKRIATIEQQLQP